MESTLGTRALLYSWLLALLQLCFCFLLASWLFLFPSSCFCSLLSSSCPVSSHFAQSPSSNSSVCPCSRTIADLAAALEALICCLSVSHCALNLTGLRQFTNPGNIISTAGSLNGMAYLLQLICGGLPVVWVGMPSALDLPTHQGNSSPYNNKELFRPHLTAAVLGVSTQKMYWSSGVVNCGLWTRLLALYPRFTTYCLISWNFRFLICKMEMIIIGLTLCEIQIRK